MFEVPIRRNPQIALRRVRVFPQYRLATPAELVPVPASFDLREAAAAMLQGMTATISRTRPFQLQAGQSCLIHAAAGGVGKLFCQMAKMRGAALIIGTARSEKKARMTTGNLLLEP